MGLHCCELSQVEDGQKMPSHKSKEGCVLVPHSNDCCSGRLVPWAAPCALPWLWHTELSELRCRC